MIVDKTFRVVLGAEGVEVMVCDILQYMAVSNTLHNFDEWEFIAESTVDSYIDSSETPEDLDQGVIEEELNNLWMEFCFRNGLVQ